ncbi:MAG: acyltransferase [Pseudomonadota bacterium]
MLLSRDANTDLVRALAIALVLVHHLGQNMVSIPAWLHAYFNLGFHGVTLFFVLSGWLIGGLYWRERATSGRVDILRFWGRRWLRTLPPYFAVLPVAYLAVWLFRAEPFELRYVFFLQNYLDEMPFFLVSWSLAVEEHFYLLLPLLLGSFALLRISMHGALLALIALSIAARLIDPAAQAGTPFGYAITASHLNMTGLMLGVYLAYVRMHNAELWQAYSNWALKLFLPFLVGFLSLPFWTGEIRYLFGSSFVSFVCAAGLIISVTNSTFRIARYAAVHKLALWSYSIYLTHALVINATMLLAPRLGVPTNLMVPVSLALILLLGGLCYTLVENPSMKLRERLIPRSPRT